MIAADGTAVAFPAAATRAALDAGTTVEFEGIRVLSDGAGLLAETLDGTPLVTHQAFWFAWRQFHPETLVWVPLG